MLLTGPGTPYSVRHQLDRLSLWAELRSVPLALSRVWPKNEHPASRSIQEVCVDSDWWPPANAATSPSLVAFV